MRMILLGLLGADALAVLAACQTPTVPPEEAGQIILKKRTDNANPSSANQ